MESKLLFSRSIIIQLNQLDRFCDRPKMSSRNVRMDNRRNVADGDVGCGSPTTALERVLVITLVESESDWQVACAVFIPRARVLIG
jgi:hypothetical protein